MRGPFVTSVGLHVALGVVMIWASQPARTRLRPLPAATVVKLIRPAAPPPSATVASSGNRVETPPPLQIPSAKKDVKEPKTSEPKKPVKKDEPKPGDGSLSKGTGKQLTGDVGTLSIAGGDGFEYDFYLAVVQSKIEQNFRPPPGMKANTMATVAFTIQKNGSITGVSLIQSSGHLLIDQAAERAIRAAGRFPPLPPQYEKGELNIHFEFVVNPAARS